MSYSHMGTPTLPSALTRFTSEFGMGSGGAMSLLSLDKKGTILKAVSMRPCLSDDKYVDVHGCTNVVVAWMPRNDVSLIHTIVMRDSCIPTLCQT
jgi:hypothetical protein